MTEEPSMDVRAEVNHIQTRPYLEIKCTECQNWMELEDVDLIAPENYSCEHCGQEWKLEAEKV